MGIINEFSTLMRPELLAYLFAGTFFGIIVGILPGIGGAVALALLIPLTIGLSMESAICVLLGAYGSSTFGGSLTAILINTPGDPTNAATCLDGYPMARQGKAMSAITAALTCSAAGGFFGLIALALMLPLARELVLMFSYPDYFMLALFGLAVIARLARGSMVLGLISVLLGLMLGFIGADPITGGPRFTFHQHYLWDGIALLPVVIGMFGMGEAMLLSGQTKPIAGERIALTGLAGILEGLSKVARHFWVLVRSSFIGVYIGMIPGIGGVVASLMAYGLAVQSSRTPERFGHGAIEGVIASESANDSKEGGSLLPTLVFGIPGSAGMAVLMGGLILHGMTPGPELITRDMRSVNFLIAAAIAGKVIALVMAFVVGTRLVFLTRIPGNYLAPVIATISLAGAYSFEGKFGDIIVAVVFGIVGVLMEKYGLSRIGFIIALVLGKLVESSYHGTMTVFGYSGFFERPIALILLGLTVLTLISPLIRKKLNRKEKGAS
jgi:putative tricarboxylic transport membrane protein